MRVYELRPASITDYPAIATLVESEEERFLLYPAGRYPWDIEQLEQLARERSDLTVMTKQQSIIGFANLYTIEATSHGFIGNVIITRAQRGHGYGRFLIEYMLDRLYRHHQVAEARISVFAENATALTLYRSLGFHPYASELRTAPGGEQRELLHLRRMNHG